MTLSPLKRRWLSPFIALALSACASEFGSLPVCDGNHRRPANPHGSILLSGETAAPSHAMSGEMAALSLSAFSCGGAHDRRS